VLHSDFVITVATRQGEGQSLAYPISAVAQGLGRVSHNLPPPDRALADLLRQVAVQAEQGKAAASAATAAGDALFRWLMGGPLETHLRLAWDRAAQAGRGLRLRLCLDPAEIAALPWEFLHDPDRDHWFATATATPLVRFLDQTGHFGALVKQEAELPLQMLLVLPRVPELDLAGEKARIEEALRPLQDAVVLHVLDGKVTRTALSDALMSTPCDIVHISGHGSFVEGTGYIGLNAADGTTDWVDARAVTRLLANHSSLKLLLLNACSTGRVDDGVAFAGLAPQLVRAGIPAVVAMQYPLTDAAALTFAREFYRQLCTGENAGQVDVAVTHARNMLAIVHPADLSFAAPVLYTHASDGVIYVQPHDPAVQAAPDPASESARLVMLMGSLQSSMEFYEDWLLADRNLLKGWRATLQRAEQVYSRHLRNQRAPIQQAARQGLVLVRARLAALDSVLLDPSTG
jgi:hypothetical protein